MSKKTEKLEGLVNEIIPFLDKNPKRQGLKKTAKNVAETFSLLTSGSEVDIASLLTKSLIKSSNKNIVSLKNIEFYSLCEHHLLPFFGHVDVVYQPEKNIVGFGAILRAIDAFCAQLTLQENLTEEIANGLWKSLKPKGLCVRMTAKHMCMQMRGSKKQNSVVTTQCSRGHLPLDIIAN